MHVFSLALLVVIFLSCCMTGRAEEASESPLEITRQAASEARRNLTIWGYPLDGSVESVKEIDRFIEENWDDESRKPIPGGLFVENFGVIMFSLGCYTGEVLVNVGGEWQFDATDPQWGMTATVTMHDGTVCCPAARFFKRLFEGPDNGIYFYTWSVAKNIRGVTENDDFIQVLPE